MLKKLIFSLKLLQIKMCHHSTNINNKVLTRNAATQFSKSLGSKHRKFSSNPVFNQKQFCRRKVKSKTTAINREFFSFINCRMIDSFMNKVYNPGCSPKKIRKQKNSLKIDIAKTVQMPNGFSHSNNRDSAVLSGR